MYARALPPPTKSFFLFGPRGTGKSTWVKTHYRAAHVFDLLRTQVFLRLQQNPSLFRKEVEALPKGTWVVIDKVQKLPILLDEVHSLLEEYKRVYRFILTGSSARKLRRDGANLLAGRVATRYFLPLSSEELKTDFALESVLRFGTLPAVFQAETAREKIEFLESYVTTYLKEEIQQEALVKNLSSFSRFLTVAALAHGQKVNLSALARDSGAARATVQGYFQILIDTLIGAMIPSWQVRVRVKEVDHPKFYFFDSGVVRAILDRLYDPLDSVEKGHLLESYVFHELRTHAFTRATGGNFFYWGTHGGVEADFIWSRGKRAVGFEVKASSRWRDGDGEALQILLENKKIQTAYGVYLGTETLKDGGVTVMPLVKFLAKLNAGKLIGFLDEEIMLE